MGQNNFMQCYKPASENLMQHTDTKPETKENKKEHLRESNDKGFVFTQELFHRKWPSLSYVYKTDTNFIQKMVEVFQFVLNRERFNTKIRQPKLY